MSDDAEVNTKTIITYPPGGVFRLHVSLDDIGRGRAFDYDGHTYIVQRRHYRHSDRLCIVDAQRADGLLVEFWELR